jgi:uncharacterized protein YdhG (YjbR/CyaY superfamily)
MPDKMKSAKAATVFSDDEKSAMKERAREEKAARAGADGEKEVLAKIAEMAGADRELAEKIHAIVKAAAPSLKSKTWYGMPAYAKDGKIVCFYQPGAKFKYRYATLGFQEDAKLDDGNIWPTSWALTKLTPADEKTIAELIKKAVG